MKRVCIIGSGFGGLTAVRQLRRRSVDAEITLIAPHKHFVYLPSLIWIPARLRQGADLVTPLDRFFARQGVRWHEGSVVDVRDGGRLVVTDAGAIENDALIIASGARHLRMQPGIEHALIPCEGIDAAEAIRDRLEALERGNVALGFSANPSEAGAMRGGPMFEFLFGLDTLLRRQRRRDDINLAFFNASPTPGQRLGSKAVAGLLARMQARRIDTHLGRKIIRFTADRVVTEGGEIPADMILFMPGLTGPAWLDATDLPKSPGGFIVADEMCRVGGFPRTYVVGDAGSFPGPDWMPKQAHQADLQAAATAANVAAELDGLAPSHRFKPELACIVDTLDAGMLVFRTEKHNLALPAFGPLHGLKQAFEGHYVRAYR